MNAEKVTLSGTSPLEHMTTSIEFIAAAQIDIVPIFFERFYKACPDQRDRFCNRSSSEGLMVNEMLGMFLACASNEPWLKTMMRAQLNTHHDHGVIELEQYRIALDILISVLRDANGSAWNFKMERAWKEQAHGLFLLIDEAF
jgi:hemoglobin-like flavoprotein